jgi:hypothetical protein
MKAASSLFGLVLLANCSVVAPERAAARQREQDRIERCAKNLPILREEPTTAYRVVRVIEDVGDENELAWYACVEHADAVISSFSETVESKTTFAGGPYVMHGRTKTKTRTTISGRAIKYSASTGSYEAPSPGDDK